MRATEKAGGFRINVLHMTWQEPQHRHAVGWGIGAPYPLS